MARLPDSLEMDFGYELGGLDEFAGMRRYEEGRMALSDADLTEMDRMTAKVLDWASTIIKS